MRATCIKRIRRLATRCVENERASNVGDMMFAIEVCRAFSWDGFQLNVFVVRSGVLLFGFLISVKGRQRGLP